MAGELHVRFATEKDVGSVAEVAKTTWKSTYEGLIPPEIQQVFLERYYAPAVLALEIKRGDGWFWVAERDGVIVGYAQVVARAADVAELARLYVLPRAQRAGVGTAFITNALALLGRLGPSRLAVIVEKANAAAVAFYRKLGFEPFDERNVVFGEQTLPVIELHLPIRRFQA